MAQDQSEVLGHARCLVRFLHWAFHGRINYVVAALKERRRTYLPSSNCPDRNGGLAQPTQAASLRSPRLRLWCAAKDLPAGLVEITGFAACNVSQSENVEPLASCCFYSCVDRHCWNLRNSSSRSSAVNLWWRGEASARCPGNWTTLSARWLGGPGLSRCVHELTCTKATISQLMRFA